jgi:hypothetical protein
LGKEYWVDRNYRANCLIAFPGLLFVCLGFYLLQEIPKSVFETLSYPIAFGIGLGIINSFGIGAIILVYGFGADFSRKVEIKKE